MREAMRVWVCIWHLRISFPIYASQWMLGLRDRPQCGTLATRPLLIKAEVCTRATAEHPPTLISIRTGGDAVATLGALEGFVPIALRWGNHFKSLITKWEHSVAREEAELPVAFGALKCERNVPTPDIAILSCGVLLGQEVGTTWTVFLQTCNMIT